MDGDVPCQQSTPGGMSKDLLALVGARTLQDVVGSQKGGSDLERSLMRMLWIF